MRNKKTVRVLRIISMVIVFLEVAALGYLFGATIWDLVKQLMNGSYSYHWINMALRIFLFLNVWFLTFIAIRMMKDRYLEYFITILIFIINTVAVSQVPVLKVFNICGIIFLVYVGLYLFFTRNAHRKPNVSLK